MNIQISYNYKAPDEFPFEVVERKGLGHPDTLVDGIVEFAEMNYAKYCLEEFGCIPHHNFDKAMLIGGMCKQTYGESNFTQPIKFIFMGRGSKSFGDTEIPLYDIQVQSAKAYLNRVLPRLKTDDPNMFLCESVTSCNSSRPYWFEPRDIFDLPEYNNSPVANDTATMISYYPLTLCEQLALDVERYFYSINEDGLPYPKYIEYGQDIKVMVVRNNSRIDITVAVPQISTITKNKDEYYNREIHLQRDILKYVQKKHPNDDINITINSSKRSDVQYMVSAGSSVDFGEEGAVGRGNKTHGIISSFRPNTMEAPHGKNSTYFVGKVLGYITDVIAKDIFKKTGLPCQIIMQANSGDCLYNPANIIVNTQCSDYNEEIRDIVFNRLARKSLTTFDILSSNHYIPNVKCI